MHFERPWGLILLTGATVLSGMGCGTDFTGFEPTGQVGKNYDGIWITRCVRDYAGPGRGAELLRVYDGDEFIAQTRVFDSAGCTDGTALNTTTITGTFEVGKEIMGNVDDAKELDLTIATVELALHPYDAIFAATALETRDPWTPGKPVDVRSYLGDTCESDDDCGHAACDPDTHACVGQAAAGTSGWRGLIAAYGIPELRAGDILYDLIVLDQRPDEQTSLLRDVLLNGDFAHPIATAEWQRPIGSAKEAFVRRQEAAAIDHEIPSWFRGTWQADSGTPLAADRWRITAQTVEALDHELDGQYRALAPLLTLEPNVFELRRTSDANERLYDIFCLYLGLTADGVLAKLDRSARTASDDPEGPFDRAP